MPSTTASRPPSGTVVSTWVESSPAPAATDVPHFPESRALPLIQNSTSISAPVDAVFAIARDVERFPDFMPEVQRITVVEVSPDGRRQVVEWVGLIPSFRLTVKWTEEDLWDEEERTCRFRQVKGD